MLNRTEIKAIKACSESRLNDPAGRIFRDTIELCETVETLSEALRDLVNAFPAGEEGTDLAMSIGVDADLIAARIVLSELEG